MMDSLLIGSSTKMPHWINCQSRSLPTDMLIQLTNGEHGHCEDVVASCVTVALL